LVLTVSGRIDISSASRLGSAARRAKAVAVAAMESSSHMPCRSEVDAGRRAVPRVLVIDDDEGMLTLLCRALERAGFKACAAGCGRAGLNAALGGDFDAVVTDIAMPRLDGLELLRRLRAAGLGVPVIVVSGLDLRPPAFARSFGALGASAVMRKPFAMADFVAAVQRATGSLAAPATLAPMARTEAGLSVS
jgi:CheY-like chemotaxis protein